MQSIGGGMQEFGRKFRVHLYEKTRTGDRGDFVCTIYADDEKHADDIVYFNCGLYFTEKVGY